MVKNSAGLVEFEFLLLFCSGERVLSAVKEEQDTGSSNRELTDEGSWREEDTFGEGDDQEDGDSSKEAWDNSVGVWSFRLFSDSFPNELGVAPLSMLRRVEFTSYSSKQESFFNLSSESSGENMTEDSLL